MWASSIKDAVKQFLESPFVGQVQANYPESRTHSRDSEHTSGRPEQIYGVPSGVAPLSPSSTGSITLSGQPFNRPVCNSPVYCSRFQDDQAYHVDCLSMNWEGIYAYAFPQFV